MNALEKARRIAMISAAEELDRQTIEILKKSFTSRYDRGMINLHDNKEDELMSGIRKVFTDEDGDQLVIKKYLSDDEIWIHVHNDNNNKTCTVKINSSQFKALRKAIKKVTKEDGQS